MKARFYDPDTGRFLQQDSYLGENNNPPSLYRYLYAYGNPTVYTDPSGRCVWDLCVAEGAVAYAVAAAAITTAVAATTYMTTDIDGDGRTGAQETADAVSGAFNAISDSAKDALENAEAFITSEADDLLNRQPDILPIAEPMPAQPGYGEDTPELPSSTGGMPIQETGDNKYEYPADSSAGEIWSTESPNQSGLIDDSPYQSSNPRGEDGRFVSPYPELSDDGKLRRKDLYPSSFREKTRKRMAELYGDGRGNYFDPYTGEFIPAEEATFDHIQPVVDHWINEGYNQTREERNDWYNNEDNLRPMRRRENSRRGAEETQRYNDQRPGDGFGK